MRASPELPRTIENEYFAMARLTPMLRVVKDAVQHHPSHLKFGRILLTMYDDKMELTHEVATKVPDFLGRLVFGRIIPSDPITFEAAGHMSLVVGYAPQARGTRAYIEFCMEVLDRE